MARPLFVDPVAAQAADAVEDGRIPGWFALAATLVVVAAILSGLLGRGGAEPTDEHSFFGGTGAEVVEAPAGGGGH